MRIDIGVITYVLLLILFLYMLKQFKNKGTILIGTVTFINALVIGLFGVILINAWYMDVGEDRLIKYSKDFNYLSSNIEQLYMTDNGVLAILDKSITNYSKDTNNNYVYAYADWVDKPSIYNCYSRCWFVYQPKEMLLIPTGLRQTIESSYKIYDKKS